MQLNQQIKLEYPSPQKKLEFQNFFIKNKTLVIRQQKHFQKKQQSVSFGAGSSRQQNYLKLPHLPTYEISYQQIDRHQRTIAFKRERMYSCNEVQCENLKTTQREFFQERRKASLNLQDIKVRITETDIEKPQNYFDMSMSPPLSIKQVNRLLDIFKYICIVKPREKYNIKLPSTNQN